ncbi:hypothetical protein [Streptomyces sp. NPDC058268]|uniref:hypothetical protein n=1 Tax=Streptomyces sp. NPDC058268 TaxID=3346413 RepID=UPI0036E6B156
MARSTFGAGVADFVVQPSDGLWAVAAGAVITFWDSADAGTQYTDLLDASSTPITSVTADEFGALPRFSGPDTVTGMWADGGGTSRAWMDAHSAATGGGGGGSAFTKLVRVVASATAPSDVRAAAAYLCDGTADQVQIQQAIDDAQDEGGGVVQLSVGDFNLAAPVEIQGTANVDDPLTVILRGSGKNATTLKPASGQSGILIGNWAQFHLEDFGVVIQGASSGIVSTSTTTTTTLSFWDSSMRNIRISGSYTPTNTGWAMDLAMPWRSTFDNIEIQGTRNGIRITNDSANQNAGDCTFNRFFVEIVGTGGYALYIDSVDGNMNQNQWNMFEAGANSSGCTGIWLGGLVGTASQRFYGLNLEQFQTCINVANGESNEFYCNYVTGDTGDATNKMFVCGANSYNNLFQAKWVNIASAGTLQIIEDLNTTSNTPNVFEKIRIENNATGTVTYTKSSSTVFRDITTFNTGNAMPAGLLQYPLTTVNNPAPTPADHNLLTWTQDPRTLRSTGDTTTAGVVYLSKLKIVNRSTVVSNILVGVVTAGATLTAGQNLVGLYNSSGTLLATSADQSTAWTTVGLKTAAIAPQTLAVGNYYVGILSNGTTRPVFATGAGHGQDGVTNAGLTTATAAFLTSGAAQTAMPASITLGSASQNSGSRWAALT